MPKETEESREKRLVRQRRYQARCKRNPLLAARDRKKGRDYGRKLKGISPQMVTAALLYQNYKCGICEIVVDETACADHCHRTGSFRGMLCNACNVGLGRFDDRTDLLCKAISYLEKGNYLGK